MHHSSDREIANFLGNFGYFNKVITNSEWEGQREMSR